MNQERDTSATLRKLLTTLSNLPDEASRRNDIDRHPRVMHVLRELREPEGPTKTIMLAACIERSQIVEAIQLGARGIVLKESAFDLLVKAIRCVMTGQYWVDRGGFPIWRKPSLKSCAILPVLRGVLLG